MAPLELEGKSLGEKHRHYNKLVKEAIASNTYVEAGDLNTGENDVENLMKIDIASHNRDVEFILKALQCEDMLYVSRAIKQAEWLVTDQQYAHIVNPTYLTTHLFPHMTANAKTKFMKHVRLHLRDETRAEQFFNFDVKRNVKIAAKWLPNCSAQFICSKVGLYVRSRNVRLFKRLCEKSPDVVTAILNEDALFKSEKLSSANFLLVVAPDKYFPVVEQQGDYCFPRFGARTTKLLMIKCPERVINNFEKYCSKIHIPTFVKYLKKEELKEFLFTQTKKGRDYHLMRFLCDPKNIKYFINAMTKEHRTQFLDQVFVNKVHSLDDMNEHSEKFSMRKFYLTVTSEASEYIFYDFDVAFDNVTKTIRAATSQKEKIKLFKLLIKCANHDSKNIQTVLKYYHDKHVNDPLKSKGKFMKRLLPEIDISKLSLESWNILDNLFKQVEIFSNTENECPGCIEITLLYKVIHDDNVPEVITRKYNLNTLKSYLNKMNDADKEEVFKYLYDNITCKVEKQKISNESEFKEGVEHLKLLLDLLHNWKKELSDYPWVLNKIKEYLKIKNDNAWKTTMSSVYNKKKSWKKLMFAESIKLCPSETVCLNALKHDDGLLSVDRDEVVTLCCDDTVSLQRLLNKMRVYWPRSLGAQWTAHYVAGLQQRDGHRAVVRGLCALLPRPQLLQLLLNYAPKEAKIVYKENEDIPLSLRKQFAKNMHLARPQPPPDAILLYVKGDYLQFALPSLLAIFNNMNAVQIKSSIIKLLSAPVSIQKHGIRLAFAKLRPEEALPAFRDIWLNTKSATIRAVIFEFTFSLLSKDGNLAHEVWETLFMFMDNLSHEENKTIYEILSRTDNWKKVPANYRGTYINKTLKFLTELIPKLKDQDKSHYEWKIDQLVKTTRDFMDCIPSDFMADIISKYLKDGIPCENLSVLSAFVLCTRADKTQSERYHQVLAPLLQHCITLWDEKQENVYFIRRNIKDLLDTLTIGLMDYVFEKKMDLPLIIFQDIQAKINQLPVPDNYIMLTKWDLTVQFTKILSKHELTYNWDETCIAVASDFGKICLEHLKRDVALHFPCIYTLFSTALKDILEYMPDAVTYTIYRSLLEDVQFVQGYLTVLKMYPRQYSSSEESDDLEKIATEVRKVLSQNTSVEVKMHYSHKFAIEA